MFSNIALAVAVTFLMAYLIDPIKRGIIFSALFCGLFFQYCYSIAAVVVGGLGNGMFEYSAAAAIWAAMALFASASIGFFVVHYYGGNLSVNLFVPSRFDYNRVFLILMMIGAIGLILAVYYADFGDYGDRLQQRSGKGYIYIFGYANLLTAFLMLLDGGRLSFYLKLVAALIGVAFFSIVGYRSYVSLIVILWIVSVVGAKYFSTRIGFAAFFSVVVALSVPVNYLTGAIRSLAASKSDYIYYNSIYNRMEDLYLSQGIPLANSHFQMLASYLSFGNFSDLIYGSHDTIYSSMFNFLPRFLFSDKDVTTGVVFAGIFFPDWIGHYGHTSSLTVGLYLDILYNFGVAFFMPVMFLYYFIFLYFVKVLVLRFKYGGLVALVLIWDGFYNAFFDDFGGVINKLVLALLLGAVLGVVDLLLRFFENRKILG